MRLHDRLADGDRHHLDDLWWMETGRSFRGEAAHRRKHGSRVPAEVSRRPLDRERYLAVARGITVRRQAEKTSQVHRRELSALTQRLLSAEQVTTRRVAQTLHDNLGQTLAAARLILDVAVASGREAMTAETRQEFARVAGLLQQAVGEVRQVLVDLRPPLLEELGLAAAIDNEVRLRAAGDGAPDVRVEVGDDDASKRWPPDIEYNAFMIVREAIANARRHAKASLVRVSLADDGGSLRLEVVDDGIGISDEMVHGRLGHLGIVGMRERATAIGGRFVIARDTAGGTRVVLRWESRNERHLPGR